MLDRHDCYELCVQSPRHVVAFLHAVHGNEPLVLREDFCGTAAVACRWIADALKRSDQAARAIAVDLDPEPLAKARARMSTLDPDHAPRIQLLQHDATETSPPEVEKLGSDIVFVGNFSIGYLHTRAQLMHYLRITRQRLAHGHGGFGGGVFVCDVYGGAGAFKLGGLQRTHPGRGREQIHYHWVHESADPLTGMVENSISFRVVVDGEVVQELPRAFVYRWRLWAIADLREAMHEAGFTQTEVYTDVNIAPGHAPARVEDPGELGDDWIVLIAARA